MTLAQAAVLRMVEGVAEYLPVSSTGHLLLAERLMGIGYSPAMTSEETKRNKGAADAYAIGIQAGAILAVFGLYVRRIKQMLLGLTGKSAEGRRLLLNVAYGFYARSDDRNNVHQDHQRLPLRPPWPVVSAWFVGGGWQFSPSAGETGGKIHRCAAACHSKSCPGA